MSSYRTRAAQRIKESFNQKLVTRDGDLEAMLEECRDIEEDLKGCVESAEGMKKALQGVGGFCHGMSASALTLLSKSALHQSPAEQLSEAHQSLLQLTSEASASFDRLLDESKQWFVLFEEVRTYQRQREKTRLVYDHYISKVEEMQTAIAKKKSKNPTYQETSKEVDRLQRNERKLEQATENFRADSQKCTAAVFQALETRYQIAAPYMCKVLAIESELYRKAAGIFSELKAIPEEMMRANRERERIASDEQKSMRQKSETQNRTRGGPPAIEESSSDEDVGGFLDPNKRDFSVGWASRDDRSSSWVPPGRNVDFESSVHAGKRQESPQRGSRQDFDAEDYRESRGESWTGRKQEQWPPKAVPQPYQERREEQWGREEQGKRREKPSAPPEYDWNSEDYHQGSGLGLPSKPDPWRSSPYERKQDPKDFTDLI